MANFDYSKYFREIEPLADALRENEERVWQARVAGTQPHRDYVLMLGCNVLRTVNLAETIVEVLKSMGIDFAAVGGAANCCGIIHHMNGDVDAAETILHHSLRNLADFRPKNVLVYCPSCHHQMDAVIPGRWEFGIPYIHVTEFLAANLHRMSFANRVPKRVGLHAHYHGPQQKKDADATLKILAAVPGLEVVPFLGGEEWGRHCSPSQMAAMGGGLYEARLEEMVGEAQRQKLDSITTVYHSCYRELCGMQRRLEFEFTNYITLLGEGLGIRPFNEQYKALRKDETPGQAFQALRPRAEARNVNLPRLEASVHTHFSSHRE